MRGDWTGVIGRRSISRQGIVRHWRSTRDGRWSCFRRCRTSANIFQTLALEPDSRLDLRSRELAVFIEHRWKVAPNLLITAGLRYDYASPPRSHDGELEQRLSLTEANVPGLDVSDPIRAQFASTFRAYLTHLDGRKTIYDSDGDNFGPRIGLVWDPSRRGTFAVRGGYGLVYDVPLGTVVMQSRNTFPAYVPLNFGVQGIFPGYARNPAFFPGPLLVPGSLNQLNGSAESLPEVLGGLFFVTGNALSFTLPERRFQTPHAHEWNVGVETVLPARSRLAARYVGTAGRELTRLALPNGGPFTNARYLPSLGFEIHPLVEKRPDPDLGPYEEFRSDASSSYHALEIEGETSPIDGLDVRAAWTWSHAIDDVSDVFKTSGTSPFAQDELARHGGPRAERASAAFDVRHRFVGTVVYTPDWGEGPGWNGWSFAGVVELSTGQPFTVVTSLDANLDGVLTDRPISSEGFVTFDAGSRIVGIEPGVDPFSLVELPDREVLFNGGLGRNTFRGRGIATVDFAVSKSFDIGRGRVELRLECFNALNRAHYAPARPRARSAGFPACRRHRRSRPGSFRSD
ncbi:MAG: TonB-dependent receptor [Blastocatellia bacterium]|nr:TonB-dependent receptor [Blastocatellia bacterium]